MDHNDFDFNKHNDLMLKGTWSINDNYSGLAFGEVLNINSS